MLSDEEHEQLLETLDKLSSIADSAEKEGKDPLSDAAALASDEIESIINFSD